MQAPFQMRTGRRLALKWLIILSCRIQAERDLTLRKRLTTQLAEVGYTPADITHVAFSHYH